MSADYVHNATLKIPLSQDVNHNGAARTLNANAAKNAVAATTASFGCSGGYTGSSIDCAIAAGAKISAFAASGLDSGDAYLGGYPASAEGLTPDTGAAFPGTNPNVGTGKFILPIGRSGYDALQVVLQQQKANPVPGILSSNLQVSYSLSRIVTASGGGTGDQFIAGSTPWDNDDPGRYIGRSNLDHTNELSFGGSITLKYGVQADLIGHFFSAPPASLTLDATSGATAQIFQTDVDGDGTYGDLAPDTNPGYYEHQIKGAGLNRLISSYNSTKAGVPTPAGNALIAAGLFTSSQLLALGGVQQAIASAPTNPLSNAALRTFDLNSSYPIRLSRFRDGFSITPGVAFYNLFNVGNFNQFGGTLLNSTDAGAEGYLNGSNNQAALNENRVVRNSGTFDQGGPRTTEFQVKVTF